MNAAAVVVSEFLEVDDEPGVLVEVFAVPQVISVLYPVRGCAVAVYSYPQLVNTVIEDFEQV